MKRRQTLSSESSLELFLDTICNTFGGILFILIFVVVLLKMTEKEVSEAVEKNGVSPVEYAAMETKLNELQNEWESLSELIKNVTQFDERLIDPESVENYRQWKKLLTENQSLMEQNIRLSAEMNKTEEAISAVQRDRDDLQQQVLEKQNSINQINSQLKEQEKQVNSAKQKQQENASVPQMREGNLFNIAVVLYGNRLYFWHKYDSLGVPLGLNTEDFTVVEEGIGEIRSRPKPWRGLPIQNTSEFHQKLRSLLTRFSPESHYITLITSEDSFGSYQLTSKTIKKLGYRIRPLPLAKGNVIADRGGSDSRSQ